jgi:flagellar biosynthesis/type III secretory pathway M-ring protein FliF/YscJ
MKKTIAAWTIAAAAVFGLAACSSTSAETDTGADVESSASAPAEEEAPAGDQSVADACSIVQSKIQEASSAVSSIDVSSASEDPQGTVDAFTETVDGVGEAVESVSNPEVKEATSAVYDDFVALRDLLSKVLIDQDMEAAGEMATAATDVQTSAQELGTLCS